LYNPLQSEFTSTQNSSLREARNYLKSYNRSKKLFKTWPCLSDPKPRTQIFPSWSSQLRSRRKLSIPRWRPTGVVAEWSIKPQIPCESTRLGPGELPFWITIRILGTRNIHKSFNAVTKSFHLWKYFLKEFVARQTIGPSNNIDQAQSWRKLGNFGWAAIRTKDLKQLALESIGIFDG
jgi:hypothetical protein